MADPLIGHLIEAPEPPAAPPRSPTSRGFGVGMAGVRAAGQGLKALGARVIGAQEIEQQALAAAQAEQEAVAQDVMRVEGVTSFGEALDFGRYALGTAAPSILASILGGVAGRVGGRLLARGAAPAAREFAKDAGTVVGLGATSTGLETGGIFPEAVEQGVDSPVLRSLAGGAAAGSLDILPQIYLARRLGVLGEAARAPARGFGARARAGATEALKTAPLEGVTEGGQEAIGRFAAGKDLSSPEALSEYINAAAIGAIAGGTIGGAGGVTNLGTAEPARPAPAPQPAVEPEAPLPTLEGVDQRAADIGLLSSIPAGLDQAPLQTPFEAAQQPADPPGQPVTSPFRRGAAPVAQDADALMREALVARRADAQARVEALTVELNSEARKRPKADVLRDMKAAQDELTQIGVQDTQIGQAMRNREAIASLPEAAPRTPKAEPAPASDIIQTRAPDPDTTAAEAAVAQVKRNMGMLVSSREAKLVPKVNESSVSLVVPKIGTPRERVKTADAKTRRDTIEGVAVESIKRHAAELAAAGAFRKGTALKAREAVISAAVEAANAPTVEAAQKQVFDAAIKALGNKVNKADAETFARLVSDDVAQAPKFYSKAGIQDASEKVIKGAQAEHTIKFIARGVESGRTGRRWDAPNRDGFNSPAAASIYLGRLLRKPFGWPVATEWEVRDLGSGAVIYFMGERALKSSASSTPRAVSPALAEQGITLPMVDAFLTQQALGPDATAVQRQGAVGNFAAAAQDAGKDPAVVADTLDKLIAAGGQQALFNAPESVLPNGLTPVARDAAVDFRDAILTARGRETLEQLRFMIGDDPNLDVRFFNAEPGDPVGSYQRVQPYKDVIELALNAKDILSLAAHEGFHYLEARKLTGGERAIINRAFAPGKPLYKAVLDRAIAYDRENGTNLADEIRTVPQEARAYGFEFWKRGELQAEGIVARIFQKIREVIERIANFVKGQGFQSTEDIFRAIELGAYAQRPARTGGVATQRSGAAQALWYVLALNENVGDMQTKQASPQGWKDQIKGLVSSGKVKQAEVDAVGINDWLDLQQGRVTKQQVADFLAQNGVRVEDVHLGAEGPGQMGIDERAQGMFAQNYDDLTRDQMAEVRAAQKRSGVPNGPPKFSQWQLPGGKNYRELLLTLPGTRTEVKANIDAKIAELEAHRDWLVARLNSSMPDPYDSVASIQRQIANDNDLIVDLAHDTGVKSRFESAHYPGIPNPLAHIRFNERTDADGKRVLFIEEIQSDWAQKGKKEGFASKIASDPRVPELRRLQRDARDGKSRDRFNALWDEFYRDHNIPSTVPLDEVLKPGVPSAPFVGKTEAWVALSLKRMIRYAAENGFDRVAWTNGEQQAARYDLSKHVSKIVYTDRNRLKAFGLSGNLAVDESNVAPEKLADFIGKDAADRLNRMEFSQPPSGTGEKVLSGLDLKVGGEGMKAFYDRIVPNVANDVLKKLGGGRVGRVVMGGRAATAEGIGGQTQPGFDITPEIQARAMTGIPLFSRAATEMDRRIRNGELEREQFDDMMFRLADDARAPAPTLKEVFGATVTQFTGGLRRWRLQHLATGNYTASKSKAYANVQKVLRAFIQKKSYLITEGARVQLSKWQTASGADMEAAGDALMRRTVGGYVEGSPEFNEVVESLTPEQRGLFDQANAMIADRLEQEFQADQVVMQATLPAADFEEWAANRRDQVDRLKREGYVPERRFGDHVVHIFLPRVDERGRQNNLTVFYEQFESEGEAKILLDRYKRIVAEKSPELQVEYGFKHKVERDTTMSMQQFLDTARRNGIPLTQVERENIAKALVAADSTKRNRLFRRKNIAGFSQDAQRVLHEFVVTTSNKIAYTEFSSAINDAAVGRAVDARVESGVTSLTTDQSTNLWKDDGPEANFYRNLSDELVDYVLVPDQRGEWSTKLRGAAMMYFLGGSFASGVVNMMSVPMNTLPWLSQYTDYSDAFTKTTAAWTATMKNAAVLRDVVRLKDKVGTPIPDIDAVPGLRDALIAAAEDGTTQDTEIHQIMGLSQGGLLARSRKVQKAIEVWMWPFRFAEQTNRIATFSAAWQVGLKNNLQGRDLYDFAKNTVDNTQNVYSEANRPGAARDPIYAMLFMFKSFPLFTIEMIETMYRQNPKSAVYMLMGLVALSGVNGLPFAEPIMDLVDTISQRLFGSPFNTRRAMRNILKDASEAVVGVDLSDLALRGTINQMTGFNVASRIGLGDFVPGTRIGAADSDYGRLMEQVLGAPFAMVGDVATGVSALSKGEFTKAFREGGPLAARNVIKATEQLDRGYAIDSKGRKLVDVSGPQAFWQSLGFSSAALARAYDLDRIDKQTEAFYSQVQEDMMGKLTKAIREGDQAGAQEVMDAAAKWSQAYPQQPIIFRGSTIRRRITESGMTLNERTLRNLPRQLRASSVAAEELE